MTYRYGTSIINHSIFLHEIGVLQHIFSPKDFLPCFKHLLAFQNDTKNFACEIQRVIEGETVFTG